ncbi:MAG: IS1634 family transposase [Alkaliphilus sp.]
MKKKKYGKYFNIEYIAEAENKCNFRVEYTVDEDKLNNDKKLDGTFLIQTNTSKYGAEELIHIYKNLNEVEMAFKVIKNELDIRPIFHRNTERVKGHVYICVLAYYIHNDIRYRLKENNIKLSTAKLLNMLRKVALVEMEIPSEKTIYNLTEISKNDKGIFDQMGIKMVAPKNK